jgi:hypothetical protein
MEPRQVFSPKRSSHTELPKTDIDEFLLQFVFDPSHYKNNLLKLYDIKVRMKPTRSLPMFYEDIDDTTLEPYDHASDHEDNSAMQQDSESEDDNALNFIKSKPQPLQQKLTKVRFNFRLNSIGSSHSQKYLYRNK